MSVVMRILLIAGSLLTLWFMLRRIRSSELQIEDSIFWIAFSALLLVLSVFPQIVYWASRLLGIQSPINMVFLLVIFVLVMRVFALTTRISQLDEKIKRLAEELALRSNGERK